MGALRPEPLSGDCCRVWRTWHVGSSLARPRRGSGARPVLTGGRMAARRAKAAEVCLLPERRDYFFAFFFFLGGHG
jgi:hypothetical protein